MVLLPPPTDVPLCHTEVTVKLIVICQYVCHMWLLNIDQICHLLSQVEVLDDQETVSACSESILGVHLLSLARQIVRVCERVAVIEVSVMTC